jgi:hypothetical protein
MCGVVIIMCFAIFGATMVVPLVEERNGKFKHQVQIIRNYYYEIIIISVWDLGTGQNAKPIFI